MTKIAERLSSYPNPILWEFEGMTRNAEKFPSQPLHILSEVKQMLRIAERFLSYPLPAKGGTPPILRGERRQKLPLINHQNAHWSILLVNRVEYTPHGSLPLRQGEYRLWRGGGMITFYQHSTKTPQFPIRQGSYPIPKSLKSEKDLKIRRRSGERHFP